MQTRWTMPALIATAVGVATAVGFGQTGTQRPATFTGGQSIRGEAIYRRECAQCHGATLQGIERAPALAGAAFLQTWQDASLARLLERIESMPPDRPERLTPVDRADVLAFLLAANGVPMGPAPLVLDREALARATIGSLSIPGIVAGVGRSTVTGATDAHNRSDGTSMRGADVPATGPSAGWPTYGGDLASTRYSPLDQIDRTNFSHLQVAWRLNTNLFGPRPDGLYSATPLVVGRTLYTTAGTRRAVVALDAVTGELRWMHAEDEGRRGQVAARPGAGRGVAYWSNADGSDQRIVYVTPGYRMLALDARTGVTVPGFGTDGVVDLKQDDDQDIDPLDPEIGLNATPLVAGDVIVVGAAHRAGTAPKTTRNVKGFVRGYDARTGKRLWIFHTVPMPGEPGFDTWDDGGALRNGNTGVWSQMSADPELGLVYVPVEMATGDYYGGKRPGNTLFDESLVALDLKTGVRRWHYQTVHHGVWDYDLACAPVLFDATIGGRRIKALAQATKQAFLFVLDRETGAPVWPIEERPVPASTVPGERTSPTQPFPTRPAPFDRQGISTDDLIDFTPQLRAEALAIVRRFRIGPMFTPPALSTRGGPLATLQVPSDHGGANWPGGSFDPETGRYYVHSHTSLYVSGIVPAAPSADDVGYVSGVVSEAGDAGTDVQGLPLLRPPYDRITAYDMRTGDLVWQKPHSSTPDAIRLHPALKGLELPRLGQPGRTFIGVLTTKTLLIAGEGGVHTNAEGRRIALLRAYDKATGEDVGAVEMPAKQTGSPMTYMIDGRQYLAVAVSGPDGAELIVYALPRP